MTICVNRRLRLEANAMSGKSSTVALLLAWGAAMWLSAVAPAAAAEPCALCGGVCAPDAAVTVTDWQTNEKLEYDCLSCAVRVMAARLPWSRVSMKSPLTGDTIKLTRTQARWTAGPTGAVVVAPVRASGECVPYRAFSDVEEFRKWAKRNARVVRPSAEPILLAELPARHAPAPTPTAAAAPNAPDAVSVPTLHDVPDSHWAHDAVVSAVAGGLMDGYPDGTFQGDEELTRYEMAMIAQRVLVRLHGPPDVIASAGGGVGNGREHPAEATPVARALVKQLADELHAAGADQGEVKAALNLLSDAVAQGAPVAMANPGTTDFDDVPQNHWAAGAVTAAAAAGLMDGYPDGTFRGDQSLRRYEIAVVLQRLLTKMAAAPPAPPVPAEVPIAERPSGQPTAEAPAVPGPKPAAAREVATEQSLAVAEQRLADLRQELADAGLSRAEIDAALRPAEDAVAARRQEREANARAERVGSLLAALKSDMRAAGIDPGTVEGAVQSASGALEQQPSPAKARPAAKRQRPAREPEKKKTTGAAPNFFGQGGLILTPSAHLIEKGTGYAGLGRVSDSNLYFGTYGLDDKLEVTATATGGDLPSRLIFSGKYLLNQSEEHDWSASVGVLDALDQLDTTIFGVWTKDTSTRAFWDEPHRLSMSAGLGAGNLMDGFFGGLELELENDLWFTGELVDFGGDDDVNFGVLYNPRPWWHVRGAFADDDLGASVFWGREF